MKLTRNLFFLTFLFSLVIILSINVAEQSPNPFSSHKRVFIPPPRDIKYFTLGYHESFADSLWLRWVQDFEICGKKKIKRKEFEEEFSGFNRNAPKIDLAIGYDQSTRDVCKKGWSFHMLDAITELAPRFRMPFAVGATSLSVLVEDHEGAKIIFDKAIKNFPHDWPIRYRAAYHYLFELKDIKKAAELMTQAADLGAPIWVKSLASRLYSKTGQLQMGIISLKQYLKHIEDKAGQEKVKERIRELELQLAEKPE